MKKVAIIGSGSWGVALGVHLAKLGNTVQMWAHSEEEKNLINNEKKCKYLKDVQIPENISCSTSYEQAIEGTDFIIHVTPSKYTREIVSQYKKYVTNQPIIICSKGFEKDSLLTLDEVIQEEMPNAKIAVLSGPSHAEEVSIEIPTALVVASKYDSILKLVQDTFMSSKMRIYTSRDIKGVELGGALKNIIAFCSGVASELQLGDNTTAALITRGLAELSRLGVKLGGQKETFYGLSGLGDLIVTCLSQHSRNRRAGELIGKGKTVQEAENEIGMTIESIDNIEVAYQLGKIHNVEMPIVDAVYEILSNKLKPEEAVNMLMNRARKNED